MEGYVKHWILSEGIPIVREIPDAQEELEEIIPSNDLVLTPELMQKREKRKQEIDKLVESEKMNFLERAKKSAERAYELREKYWGRHHPLALSSLLLKCTLYAKLVTSPFASSLIFFFIFPSSLTVFSNVS